jgi:NAD(P)-dependent dehydrogenase (short-subunit alcohol dehydrogenase family)
MDLQLNGKTAIVTGASRGVGLATAASSRPPTRAAALYLRLARRLLHLDQGRTRGNECRCRERDYQQSGADVARDLEPTGHRRAGGVRGRPQSAVRPKVPGICQPPL